MLVNEQSNRNRKPMGNINRNATIAIRYNGKIV